MNTEIKAYLQQWLRDNRQEFYQLADYIWDNPELGLEEFKACTAIKGLLEKHGFTVATGLAGMPTSMIASYGSSGPKVGINVEYDCLPGLSQKADSDHPDPVIPGAPGQGCGHNILGSTAVFAGVALRYAFEQFGINATLKLFGSPAEEFSVGKPHMGRAGLYRDIDFFIDWHPWNYNRADYDTCNSVFSVKYHWRGKTAHGAAPWEGRSAMDAGMLFGHAVEILREHLISAPADSANTVNYNFSDTGPEFPNIVPDRASIWLYGRFNEIGQAEDALRRITLCAEGAAMATETTVEREMLTFTHNKLPNKTLSQVVHRNFAAYGPPDFTSGEQDFVKGMQKNAGLEPVGLDTDLKEFGPSGTCICDTSEFSWNAPYTTFWMTMAPAGGWHNWMVTACAGNSIGKKTMDKASLVMAASVADILSEPGLIAKAKDELKERLNGRTYQGLLPDTVKPPLGMNKAIMQKYFPQ